MSLSLKLVGTACCGLVAYLVGRVVLLPRALRSLPSAMMARANNDAASGDFAPLDGAENGSAKGVTPLKVVNDDTFTVGKYSFNTGFRAFRDEP